MEEVRYGDDPSQRLELTRPAGVPSPPVALLIHGGFWRAQHGLEIMRRLVPSLVADGWAVANVEYRRVGDGGGWPTTLADAAAATDALADQPGLDLDRVVSIGHSAGGHLATWLAARPRLPAGAPGASPRVILRGAVSQAGVVDLVGSATANLGAGAAQDLLGGAPSAVPDRYAVASPLARLPLGVPVALVHGVDDDIVPVDQSRRYAIAAQAAGDDVALHEVPGDHFVVIDPNHPAWTVCRAALRRLR
jgi:acetyl esterase/lipase